MEHFFKKYWWLVAIFGYLWLTDGLSAIPIVGGIASGILPSPNLGLSTSGVVPARSPVTGPAHSGPIAISGSSLEPMHATSTLILH